MEEEEEWKEKGWKGKMDKDELIRLSRASRGRCYFCVFRMR